MGGGSANEALKVAFAGVNHSTDPTEVNKLENVVAPRKANHDTLVKSFLQIPDMVKTLKTGASKSDANKQVQESVLVYQIDTLIYWAETKPTGMGKIGVPVLTSDRKNISPQLTNLVKARCPDAKTATTVVDALNKDLIPYLQREIRVSDAKGGGVFGASSVPAAGADYLEQKKAKRVANVKKAMNGEMTDAAKKRLEARKNKDQFDLTSTKATQIVKGITCGVSTYRAAYVDFGGKA